MKHFIDYKVVSDILLEVFSGKNLSEVFNRKINLIEKSANNDNNLNKAKIKDLSYGVLRHYFEIRSIIKKLCKNNPDDKINIILSIGLYELRYTKKPKFAVTNDLVSFCYKETKNIGLKNFVNAVFRNFLRFDTKFQQEFENNKEYKYNFPIWFINKLNHDYKERSESIIASLNQKPAFSLRVRSHILDNYPKLLDEQNIKYQKIDNVVILNNSIAVAKIPLFADGGVSIQDINAQQLLKILPIKNGQYVLDACSAPGGKSCQILENFNVNLVALDIDNSRLDKVRQNLLRLKLNAKVVCGDASKLGWWDNKPFDIVIADVPCSATGTIKHNPDIKLHRQLNDIASFVLTQRKIVINLWEVLKPGGVLVYITCSIFKEENQDNVIFLKSKLNAILIKELQILPDAFGDGFYYCVLQKSMNID